MKWWRKAAEQGLPSAQSNLGVMYEKGRGVPEDYVRSYMWYSLAKAQGDETAAVNLDFAQKQMSPAQIAKAQELTAEWLEKHNN